MAVFRSIFLCSALVGLIVGLAISLAQQIGTVPLILDAEVYEQGAENGGAPGAAAQSHEMAGHDESKEAWEPADGFERIAFTVVANILTAIGYALILIGLFALRGKPIGWREGLFWGLCGFIAVVAAPSFGLSPEPPGIPAAPLLARQVWWIGTAAATAAGLALLVFRRSPWVAAAAIVLFALPHLIGAPLLAEMETSVPDALAHEYIVAVILTGLLFWALLGSLSGALYRRFILRSDQPSLPRRGTG
jgi:cobalt transporter subunit CbtA